MRSIKGRLTRGIAVVTALAAFLSAPGLGAHSAFAAVVAPVRVGAPVGGFGSVGAVGGMRLGPSVTGPSATQLALPGMGLPTFGGLSVAPQGGALALPPSSVSPTQSARPSAQPSGAPGSSAATPAAAALTVPLLNAPASFLRGGSAASSSPLPQRQGPGGPEAVTDSLSTVRGQSNKLGARFNELQAAFASRDGASSFDAAGRALGSNKGSSESPALVSERAGVDSRPPYVSRRSGLAPSNAVAQDAKQIAAYSSLNLGTAPKPLVLETEGLKVSVRAAAETGARAGARAALRPMGLAHMGDFDALSYPQDFDGTAKAQAKQTKGVGSRTGLGKVALALIGSLVVAQVGVEAFGAAMPSLIQKTFGDFTVIAQLAIAGSFASIAGRQFAGFVVRRLGLKNTYLAANGTRLISMSIMAGLLAAGIMPLWLMGVFYALHGAMLGISMTALESIVPAIQGRDAAKLEKFWTWEQSILEIAAIITPIATGALVASLGFLPALVAFPVAMLASLVIVWKFLDIPKQMERIRAMELTERAVKGRGFFGRMTHGARMVWTNPVMRYAFLTYTFYVMLNPFLYTLLAPAFGLRLMPTPEAAASVQGFLVGFYSLGGLLGGITLILEQARGKKAKAALREQLEKERGPIADADFEKEAGIWESARMRKSMLRWLLAAAVGLGLIASFAFPMGTLGQAFALPAWLAWASGLTPQAGALVLFGIAQVISVLKLRSYFQSRVPLTDEKGVPTDNMPDAMGFFGSASLLVSTLGLIGLKTLFQNLPGFEPFQILAWSLAPLAAVYLFLRWRLARASAQ